MADDPFNQADTAFIHEKVQSDIIDELSKFGNDIKSFCDDIVYSSELFTDDSIAEPVIKELTQILSSASPVSSYVLQGNLRYQIYTLLFSYLLQFDPVISYLKDCSLLPPIPVFAPLLTEIEKDITPLYNFFESNPHRKIRSEVEGEEYNRTVDFGLVVTRLLYKIYHLGLVEVVYLENLNVKFIEMLLEMVEATRDMSEEYLNDKLVWVLLALNEHYLMFDIDNKVFNLLRSRVDKSRTFGETLLFIFNRSSNETIHLLILKLLYLIFTTPETFHFFYTNDLDVLLDVLIRQLYNTELISGKNLRHSYLRVLHVFLLNSPPPKRYKQGDVKKMIDSLCRDGSCLDVMDETTKRLAKRIETDCAGYWNAR
ncbi:hypothetical protein BKA69DRAFT_128928 [Paraphysoderma sedebokerense]|nr:hypothetical protein BKA69DRAFT_128928 [Paraphysoderma sedebokerense]